MFLEAKLSYDTLISIDSAKGEYYYKRGNCESMISDNKTNAIIDFLKQSTIIVAKGKKPI